MEIEIRVHCNEFPDDGDPDYDRITRECIERAVANGDWEEIGDDE
jgi:hypothetical protein